MLNKIPGRVYLFVAILIFAASNSVTRQLIELGENYLIDGRNPISFCNVLFVGNLCALLALVTIYGRSWRASSLNRLSVKNWLSLVTVAILSGALAPSLVFFALDITSVNNVVLIGRIEPPLALAISILILKERVNGLVILGAIISFVGVALTVILQSPSDNIVNMAGVMEVGRGELMVALAAISQSVSNTVSKVSLAQIPLGIFSVFRVAVGTVVFFAVVIKLFGVSHFTDVFAPVLWQWMLVYGAVIVVGGQLSWFQGLKRTKAADVSLASSFSPLAGILFAYLILREVPTSAQYIGGAVIILGIIFNQVGVVKQNKLQAANKQKTWQKDLDHDVGFKGI
ncbi:conserved membrane hypothetical protein [Hyella patelloides LEGE 07179]|uniref:EamA domain-containing protein n=1 Tax=Hyella patelloides LEGE 07179 TaxID=945734 RepID=A0A563W479_9CYAN|nr:DMT family transporter [Hyella patelloides]VEP18343.1 conserved membrane hypothetical protein [Hyella patelloides LEGE 07179]